MFVPGKLKSRSKRRVSSESPQKSKTSPEKKSEKRRKSSIKSPSSNSSQEDTKSPISLSEVSDVATKSEEISETSSDKQINLNTSSSSKVKSSLPIRLPTKCKPKTDSDSDSDSKSTKSSASSSGRVSKSFKKTFKGKAIAIVKPFSNAVTEKNSPTNEKQKEIESRLCLYDFGSDEDRDSAGQRIKAEDSSDKSNSAKDSLEVKSDIVSLSNPSSSISSIKGIKRIKSVKQGLLSSRRSKLNPELKSVRVRVEKLQNNSTKGDKLKARQAALAKSKTSSSKPISRLLEKDQSSEKDSSISYNLIADSSLLKTEKREEKVFSESESTLKSETVFHGKEANVPDCKEEPSASESLVQGKEDSNKELDKLVSSNLHNSADSNLKIESVPSEIQSVYYKSENSSGDRPSLLQDDKIIEIVKAELFSQPPSLTKDQVKVKPEKSVSERNEDCQDRLSR